MAFVSDRLRRELQDHRVQQHRAWAELTPEARLRSLYGLRAFVVGVRGSLAGVDSDEPPALWRAALARRRALTRGRSPGP
ncbi:MAG: hypothetical protein HY909_31390 [Deltaproteobacteria bacterium]|nr:hypothetical protein [Deltaproteobacteria bacterium]